MNIRAIIVDDESLGRDNVKLALKHEPDLTIVGECGSGPEAVEMIGHLDPDLVFLDIQMPGGDAFEVIRQVGAESMPVTIFVTAFDTHALRAFDVHALDYVLKPFDEQRLSAAVERARELIASRDARVVARRLAAFIRDVRPDLGGEPELADVAGPGGPSPLRRITVKQGGRIYFVRIAEIDSIETSGNYVQLHVRDKTYRLRSTIRELLPQLDPSRFRRIHRTSVVNVEAIREVQPWFGGDYVAILNDGRKLRVSRTYAAGLLRKLQ